MRLEELATNPNKETSGVWVRYGSGVRFRIGRGGTPEYEREAQRALKGALDDIRKGELTDLEMLPIIAPIMAKRILRDWDGITDNEGKPVPYTEELGAKMLADARYRDIARWILTKASDPDLFRDSQSASEIASGN